MAQYEKNVMALTKVQALIWLKKNDPEEAWTKMELSRDELVRVIWDNLSSFGEETQAPGLRAVLS